MVREGPGDALRRIVIAVGISLLAGGCSCMRGLTTTVASGLSSDTATPAGAAMLVGASALVCGSWWLYEAISYPPDPEVPDGRDRP